MTAVNQTSSLGWIYVVVSDTRSAGPRQPVPSWLPGSAVAVYGSLLTVVGFLLNATLLGSSLVAGKDSSLSAVRRLLTANLAAVQLCAAVLVVPAAVLTEAVGGWTLGGDACRAWLVGQVLLIASTMWSVVALHVDCLLRLTARRRASYVVLAERHPRCVAVITIISSWVVAGLAVVPIAVAVSARHHVDNSPLLEDVCAVTLSRRDVIAQSLVAFLLPGAIALTGSVTLMALKVGGQCSGVVAVVVVGVACVLLWSPFFVLYSWLPFCHADRLCVDPATWTLFAWLGHSTVVVAPAASLFDPAVRSDVINQARRCCARFHGNVTSSASSVSDGVGNVVDESSGFISVAKYQIQRPAQQQQQQPHNDSPRTYKSAA